MAPDPVAPLAAGADAPRAGRRVWLAAILAVAVAGVVGLSWHRYVTLERELTEAALVRQNAVGALAASTLAVKFERVLDVGVALATRVRFRELAAVGRWEEAGEILRRVPRDFDFVDRVFLTDAGGELMAEVPQATETGGRSFARHGWFAGVSRDWQPYVSQLYRRTAAPERNVIAVAIPIPGPGDRTSGALVLEIRLETFFDWVRGIDLGAESRVLVVDAAWRTAFDSRSPAGAQLDAAAVEPLVQRLAPGTSAAHVARDPQSGRELVLGFAPAAHGWGVVTAQDARAAFAARDTLLRQLLLDGALIALLAGAALVLATTVALQRRREAAGRAQRAALERAQAALARNAAELERRVAERTAELEAANKDLESFSYSVSHDLRAPLRAVDGFARMVLEDYGGTLDAEGQRLLRVIRDASRKMGGLIDDLLQYSRLGRKPLARAEIDMRRLVEAVLDELAPSNRAGARVEVGRLPPAFGDATLLKQVWANLLGNAIKFSARRARPVIAVRGEENGTQCIYCVQDNGAGFDMRYRDKLFQVFQRLHRDDEFEGTGVGLAIVQRVVARHGGHAWAEGAEDAGATFHFSLPKAAPA